MKIIDLILSFLTQITNSMYELIKLIARAKILQFQVKFAQNFNSFLKIFFEIVVFPFFSNTFQIFAYAIFVLNLI